MLDNLLNGKIPIRINMDKEALPSSSQQIKDASVTPPSSLPTLPTSSFNKNIEERLPSKYVLNRSLTTVADVMKEWEIGYGDGPSVKKLEETYKATGIKWRSEACRALLKRRMPIINHVVNKVTRSSSWEEEAAKLDIIRLERKNCSLDSLAKSLKNA